MTPVPEPVRLHVHAQRKVSFAAAQNDAAILEEVAIENRTDDPLTDVRLALRTAPPVLRRKTWIIEHIAPQSTHTVRDTSTDIDIEYLSGLNEAEHGSLELVMESAEHPPLTEHCPLELLARDEWGGLGNKPHLLAAFVAPNDAAIARLLRSASLQLEHAGYDGAMNGYQSADPVRAYMLAAAVWSAATDLSLTYAEPPASFERTGQKVRGPSRITEERLATCLDTTLLLCAAFEAAGLHPVAFFGEDHTWAGVWITPRDFGDLTETDPVAVRKAVQANELVAIETTLLTRYPAVPFDAATDEGRRRLSEGYDPEFVVAVDIARARAARIRPLAGNATTQSPTLESEPRAGPAPLPPLPDFGHLPGELVDETPTTPAGRIERWQRKLLDLTLRNNLLNLRDGRKVLPLRCASVDELASRLADGKTYRGMPLAEHDPIEGRTISPQETKRIEENVVKEAFDRNEIAVPLTKQGMEARMLELHRSAKTDLQEGGANTLFLAAGFLRWKKSPGEDHTYRAPLVLIPIKLERNSAHAPFRIKHHEDEPRINTTLLELLKADFGLHVPERPKKEDCNGTDPTWFIETMRQHVRDTAGLEVVEDVALGIFAFSRFLMWRDLVDRTDQLRQSRLVRHLIDGGTETYAVPSGVGAPVTANDIDRRCAPSDLLTPLPADSSQLAAIVSAAEGHDLVLIGPPGTGKSQTITNIIAQVLSTGKTVLFVAEKAAALDVVHRRLKAHGLGDAVLELHSNKTDRRRVLTQLGKGWARAAANPPRDWTEITDELECTQNQLNEYVEALHNKGTHGLSVYDAFAHLATGPVGFQLAWPDKDAHDAESYKRLAALAAEAGRAFAAVGTGPSLSLVERTQFSYEWQGKLIETADALRRSLHILSQAETVLAQALGLHPDPDLHVERRTRLRALTPRTGDDALDLGTVPDLEPGRLIAFAEELATNTQALADARARTAATYAPDAVSTIPLDELDIGRRSAQTKIWPFSALARRRVRKLLQTYAQAGHADPAVDLPALIEIRARSGSITSNPLDALARRNGETDPEHARHAVHQAITLRTALGALRPDAEDAARFDAAHCALVGHLDGTVLEALRHYLAAETDTDAKTDEYATLAGARPQATSTAALIEGLDTLIKHSTRLQDWTAWTRCKAQATASGLAPLVDALETGALVPSTAETAFRCAYATWWVPKALDAHPALCGFTRSRHEHAVEHFRDLVDETQRLAPAETMRRIAHPLPPKDTVPRKSPLGTLRHQMGLARPSRPVRELLSELHEEIDALAPCVLMSPLSIAQYLPAGQKPFDVVIFDEASQISTWDAIGAIARGRQTIIVGDPKQLPPTNFFGRTDDEDEDLPESDRDLPSILDEVVAAGVPQRTLDWHYRSRDESLIAFSNHTWYEHRLVTFPAPDTNAKSVHLHRVDGVYARSGARTNQAEAKAVVEMATRHLVAELDRPQAERHTLGIVTFNTQQQTLILDLLDAERRRDESLEWFFSSEREEPVIVKNLESIQGDERDVILFSVTFGPDPNGKCTMNFGPINSTGGERRLNVAITRARRALHVFASLGTEDIDLGRTGATGVRDLKNFLGYVEHGAVTLTARDEGSLGTAENPFEQAVADALRTKGWEVRTQIGVSGFRIDLAVVHPDRAGHYLAGVECDGATYHSSASARDRDKIRQAVLEDLGWTILRVWSTDWFRSPGDVLDRIDRKLAEHLESDRAAHAEREAEETVRKAREEEKIARHAHEPPREAAPPATAPRTTHGTDVPLAAAQKATQETDGPVCADPARFFESSYTQTLCTLIGQLVEDDPPPAPRRAHEPDRASTRPQARRQPHQRSGAGVPPRGGDPPGAHGELHLAERRLR